MRTLLLSLALSAPLVAQQPRSPLPQGTTGQAPVVSETVAVQVMLDRAGFSPGEIDGRPGRNLKQALAAFQKAQGLNPSGAIDKETWERLSQQSGNQPPLITYALAEADVAGPFTPDIPQDLMAQGKLPALNYRNALEAVAEKFHASPALIQSLNGETSLAKAGEQISVPNVTMAVPSPTKPAVTLVVTRGTSALTIEDESGAVIFHAPVTSGSQHDPLPIGTWKVNGIQQNPQFHYNPDLFWDANPSHAKTTLPPGPNNPVGTVWIDISKEHYGIHGSPEPSRIGHVQSHGCVRLTNWDAQRVAALVKPGTKVVFTS
jgi:lipoprotein-anchoring transpeptidase ErfK/SrfK